MKFTKDSKVARISAFAEGYYSGATAYGELYMPYEFYEKHKNALLNITAYVYELDGKHSEVQCDIEFKVFTILDVLKMEDSQDEYDRDLDEKVFLRVCDILNLDDEQAELLNTFHIEFTSLEKASSTETIAIVLTQDTLVEQTLLPSGALVEASITKENPIDDNWSWEFDWNLF